MRRPNIILVTLDTMRADRLGREVRGRALTPNLSELAGRGTTFTRAVAAGVPTYFSFPVLFRGGHALGAGKRIGLKDGKPTFVEELRAAGYATAAVVASNPYLSRYYAYDRGFDRFEDFSAPGGGRSANVSRAERFLGRAATTRLRRAKAGWNHLRESFGEGNPSLHAASRGEAVTAAGLDLMKRLEAPFFLWLHLMDLHGYYFSKPSDRERVLGADGTGERLRLRWERFRYLTRWTELILASESRPGPMNVPHTAEDRRLLEGFYDASVAYTDRWLGRLLGEARDRGDTVVVATSDHGEEFFEHGRVGHAPFSLYDEVVRVPLVVAGPDVPVASVDSWVSHASMPETMLGIAGVDPGGLLFERPDGPVLTESLWGLTTPFPREHLGEFDVVLSAREGRLKLIRWEGDGREELYDLEADPGERCDLTGDERFADAAARLRKVIEARAGEAAVQDARYVLERRVRAVRDELERRSS